MGKETALHRWENKGHLTLEGGNRPRYIGYIGGGERGGNVTYVFKKWRGRKGRPLSNARKKEEATLRG